MSFLDRVRRWFAKPAVERAEEEQYMSAAERAQVEEGAEGLAADMHAEERFGPLPHERDTD